MSALTFPLGPAEPYAWPGGYPIGYLMDDGEYLCSSCMNDPSNPVHSGGQADGWRLEGLDVLEGSAVDYDGPVSCAHCGAVLVAAELPNWTDLSDRAFALGREHGVNTGSWVIDGNTSTETAARIIQGYEDGDPEILDMEPSPLSGEWADSPTPKTLADELELAEEYRGSELDQLCTDYELGFSEGYWAEVTRAARAILS